MQHLQRGRARASRTTEACAWVYLASGSRTRLLIVSSATGKIQIQGLGRHCVTIFAEVWKQGGIRKNKLSNSKPWATLCDNLCRSMEARGDQKIYIFYCWRLKESTPALARQQALALAARARASQTTEACAWAHRLSLHEACSKSVSIRGW